MDKPERALDTNEKLWVELEQLTFRISRNFLNKKTTQETEKTSAFYGAYLVLRLIVQKHYGKDVSRTLLKDLNQHVEEIKIDDAKWIHDAIVEKKVMDGD